MSDSFTVPDQRPLVKVAIAMAGLGAFFLVLALVVDGGHLAAATGLICGAAVLYFTIPPATVTEIDDDEIWKRDQEPIRCSGIDSLTSGGVAYLNESQIKWKRVELISGGKVITLNPKSLKMTRRIFGHILPKLRSESRPDLLPPALKSFYTEQVEKFGTDRVWAFGKREIMARAKDGWSAVLFGISCLVIALITPLVGTALDAKDWAIVPFTSISAIVGITSLLVGWIRSIGIGKKFKNLPAGLVLAPQGIGLVQGGISGQETWERLGGATFRRLGYSSGIQLLIPGTTLVIADVYSSPLQQIDLLIKAYLGQGPA